MIDPVNVLQIGAALVSAFSIGVFVYALKTAGRDRPHNEVAVRALIDDAPYHRLDNILSDRR